jgi:peptidoglycan/LPS O-acetylase OafA/YrhL
VQAAADHSPARASFTPWRTEATLIASPVIELPRHVAALDFAESRNPDRGAEQAAPRHRTAAPGQRFYRPELDILRLIAFLMVWCAHASIAFRGLLPGGVLSLVNGAGSLGVPVFFFLSAYLITELLRREHALTGAVALRAFYMRRILRIWPLYFGILAAYGLLGLRYHGFRIEPGRLLASFFMAGNWYIAAHPGLTTPLRHLWSISVEEQWYLLWPIVAIAPTPRRLLWFCGSIFLASQFSLVYLFPPNAPRESVSLWVNSGVQFQFLALGAAAALLLDGRIPRFSLPARGTLAALAAGAFVLAAAGFPIKQIGIAHTAASLCGGYLCAGLGSACLFFSLLGVEARCCPRSLVRLGQLSYGLYVLHETGVFLAGALVRRVAGEHDLNLSLLRTSVLMVFALALTVGLAFASYYAWELPFLRLKQRWTVVGSRTPA